MPNLLVVDSDIQLTERLRAAWQQLHRVQACATEAEALSVLGPQRIDLVIAEYHLPDGSGLDILSKLDARHYPSPILVVSGRSDIPCVVEAIKRGAFDYIEKHRAAEDLVARVREAVDVLTNRTPDHGAWDPARPAFPGASSLTPREHEVLAQIVGCASNKEAAMKLGISRRTVEIHRAHIMQKLGAKNSVDLMRIVMSRPPDLGPRQLSA